jgi:hypothetical protein
VEFEDPRDAEDAVRGLDGRYVSSFYSDTLLLAKAQVLIFVELHDENVESYT